MDGSARDSKIGTSTVAVKKRVSLLHLAYTFLPRRKQTRSQTKISDRRSVAFGHPFSKLYFFGDMASFLLVYRLIESL